MNRIVRNYVINLIVMLGLVFITVTRAYAAASDYRFELVEQTFHAKESMQTVRLRLVHIPTGETIPGAQLDEPKLIMLMPGMEDMEGHAVKQSPDKTGNYRIAAHLTEPGDWVLSLSAKVSGEEEAVLGSFTIHVE